MSVRWILIEKSVLAAESEFCCDNIMLTCPYNVYSGTPLHPRGIHYFLIFDLKHRLWVLVEAVLMCTHNLQLRAKIRIISHFFI